MQVGSVAEVLAEVRVLAQTRSPTATLIALDGRSGSGKSTLAHALAEDLDAVVVEADDFYSGGSMIQWARRSARLRADLCIDWARLRREALIPLLAGTAATWHPFDWDTETALLAIATTLRPAPFVILDGAFSTRPELMDLIDYTVLVTVSDGIRRERLNRREGEQYLTDWHPIWAAAEDYYFTHVQRPTDFDAHSPATVRLFRRLEAIDGEVPGHVRARLGDDRSR
jgi:uridine kinase